MIDDTIIQQAVIQGDAESEGNPDVEVMIGRHGIEPVALGSMSMQRAILLIGLLTGARADTHNPDDQTKIANYATAWTDGFLTGVLAARLSAAEPRQ